MKPIRILWRNISPGHWHTTMYMHVVLHDGTFVNQAAAGCVRKQYSICTSGETVTVIGASRIGSCLLHVAHLVTGVFPLLAGQKVGAPPAGAAQILSPRTAQSGCTCAIGVGARDQAPACKYAQVSRRSWCMCGATRSHCRTVRL